MTSNIICGYITFKDQDEAKTICRQLVDKKLIACANIFANHTAIYSWNEQTQESSEVAALIKTQNSHTKQIETHLKKAHSYETPAFITWETQDGSKDFLKWVQAQTNLRGQL